MSIRGSTVNYAGRQVDIELLQTILYPEGTQAVVVSNVHSTPKIVAGIQKAVQRYTLLLLTTTGDVRFNDAEGTDLLTSLASGTVSNQGVFQYLFALANRDALTQLANDDASISTFGSIPDDERIVSASLIGYNIDHANSTVQLTVLLTTAAGTTVSYIIPVTTARNG